MLTLHILHALHNENIKISFALIDQLKTRALRLSKPGPLYTVAVLSGKPWPEAEHIIAMSFVISMHYCATCLGLSLSRQEQQEWIDSHL